MAAEDQVVDMLASVVTKLAVAGVDVALKISGTGAKAIALSFYSLGKTINRKIKEGKQLSPGEKSFTDLIKSGDEIHSVWIDKKYLTNFAQISKELGIPYVVIQNGDEIKNGKGFLNKGKDNLVFEEAYKDKVSISYRASDEVRMAHILEMFDTFNKSETVVETDPKKVSEVKDDVEEFIKDNGVNVEIPPEAIASEEVKNNEQAKVSENGLKKQNKENSGILLCFEQFGFDKVPSRAEFDSAYKEYVEKNSININEPNFITALYEQGCECIAKTENDLKKSEVKSVNSPVKANFNEKIKPDVDEAYKFFGFDKVPTVYELRQAYENMINNAELSGPNIIQGMYDQACDLIDKPNEDVIRTCYEFFGFDHKPTKSELDLAYQNYSENSTDVVSPLAKNMYENCLHSMEKSKSIREILEAKKELHILNEKSAENSLEKAVDKSAEIKGRK